MPTAGIEPMEARNVQLKRNQQLASGIVEFTRNNLTLMLLDSQKVVDCRFVLFPPAFNVSLPRSG
jgi:hypothetical protein